jgi:SWI/SNF-related matrix-associated actin-dependent regulator 1 of chromatin subfamily A
MMQLRKYQETGAQFLRERKYALLADEPGLGKTAQAIMALPKITSQTHILIICPAAVKNQWQEQFIEWVQYRPALITNTKDYIPQDYLGGNVVQIINYDLLIRPKLFHKVIQRRWSHIICDEAHRIKNPKAKRTDVVLGHLLNRTENMWFLTGTPIKNRPIDLYPILSKCAPELIKPYNSYMRFALRYCGAYMGAFGLVTTGASRSDELGDRLKPFMLRRLQKDVVTELPQRIVQKIEFECTPEVERVIALEEEKTEQDDDSVLVHNLGETSRIRKALAMFKIDDAVDFIEDRLQEVEKIVVFFHHHDVMHALIKKLQKYDPIFITGNDKPAVRHEKVHCFRGLKKIRILLGQMQACGEGVDGLQHACHTCVFVEPSWSPTEIDQCIHRLERMGQKEVVNAYLLIIKDTPEAQMMETAEWKTKVYNKTYKASEEESRQQEDSMHIEERLENIEKTNVTICSALTKLAEAMTALAGQKIAVDPLKTGKPAPATTAPKTTGKPKPAPVEAEDVEVVDHNQEECRALAAELCKKPGMKAKCAEAIKNAGAEKMAGLDQIGLNKLHSVLEGMLYVINPTAAEKGSDDL